MAQIRRALAWLLALVLVPIAVISVNSRAAQADPILPTNYPPADISQLFTNANPVTHLRTHADGGVSVARPCIDNTVVLRSLSATGATTLNIANSNSYPVTCPDHMAVSKDGTVFTMIDGDGHNKTIVALKNNQTVWSYQPNCGPYWGIAAMVMGANGNVYVAIVSGMGSCSNVHLFGLTAAAQPGTGAPQVVLTMPISGPMLYGGLAAYDQGLVVQKQGSLQFIDYDGTAGTPINYTMANNQPYIETFKATMEGRVFITHKANPNAVFTCLAPDAVTGAISAVEPNGIVWTTSLDGCTQVSELAPTPWGGFVMLAAWWPLTGGERHNKISAFDGNGNLLWATTLDSYGLEVQSIPSIAVDLNGNVLIRYNAMVGKDMEGSHYKFPEIRFWLVSGITGETVPGGHGVLRGDNTTTSGPSYMWSDPAVRIAKNTLYVSAYQCTTYFTYGCNLGTAKMYAFTVPGLEIDYPRGAIFKHSQPWKKYVAMGDSFSSGEGVPPFLPGTDTAGPPENGCHRSQKAYPLLLGGNPALGWQQPLFVACSGATTQNVLHGQYNEPAQIDALGPEVDVVTITIGGNDVGFDRYARKCVGWPSNPGSICDASSVEYQDTMNRIDNVLPLNLTSTVAGNEGVFRRIRQQAPNALIYVFGYPHLAPMSSEPHDWPWCLWLNSSNEHTAARHVVTQLNLRIQQAVATMGEGFIFVDPNTYSSSFVGHELCDDESYFNGVQIAPSDEEYSLHPNLKGQDAYRRLFLSTIAE